MTVIATTFHDDHTEQFMSIIFVEDRTDQALVSTKNNVGPYQHTNGVMLVDYCMVYANHLPLLPPAISRQAIDATTKLRFFIVAGGKLDVDQFMTNAAVPYEYINPIDWINEVRKKSQDWHQEDMFSDELFVQP